MWFWPLGNRHLESSTHGMENNFSSNTRTAVSSTRESGPCRFVRIFWQSSPGNASHCSRSTKLRPTKHEGQLSSTQGLRNFCWISCSPERSEYGHRWECRVVAVILVSRVQVLEDEFSIKDEFSKLSSQPDVEFNGLQFIQRSRNTIFVHWVDWNVDIRVLFTRFCVYFGHTRWSTEYLNNG